MSASTSWSGGFFPLVRSPSASSMLRCGLLLAPQSLVGHRPRHPPHILSEADLTDEGKPVLQLPTELLQARVRFGVSQRVILRTLWPKHSACKTSSRAATSWIFATTTRHRQLTRGRPHRARVREAPSPALATSSVSKFALAASFSKAPKPLRRSFRCLSRATRPCLATPRWRQIGTASRVCPVTPMMSAARSRSLRLWHQRGWLTRSSSHRGTCHRCRHRRRRLDLCLVLRRFARPPAFQAAGTCLARGAKQRR
mmetsp:Transcript_123565/g.308778  ORF Transcript_123565/g.308778 Transcript_123565/m.308778 type:complete len:255 (-) Transcript_123565:296-1060(-)